VASPSWAERVAVAGLGALRCWIRSTGRRSSRSSGSPPGRVRRHQLISHLLGALSLRLADEVVFVEGTVLARSLCWIDLLAISRRG
jgi:hypothetical protein